MKNVINKRLPFLERSRRLDIDRRINFGKWARYQKRKGLPRDYMLPFEQHWVFLAHGDLKFSEKAIFNGSYTYLIEVGERRAAYAKHPATDIRLVDIIEELEFGDRSFYIRNDTKTRLEDFLVSTRSDSQHLIYIELNILKFGRLISEESYTEFDEILKSIPRWEE